MKVNQIKLEEADVNRLKSLAEMINMGSGWFTKEINLDDLSHKQLILYLNFGAVNNYAEAIYVLCSDMRPFPAIVVLRSIVEAYINTAYMLTHNSDKRIVLFSMEDSYYRKGLSEEFKKFLHTYPEYEKERFDSDILEEGIKITKKEVKF